MRASILRIAPVVLAMAAPSAGGWAQTDPAATKAPESLVLYFDSGSSAIRQADVALLDQAARLYRDGHPIVMVVSGSTDSVGKPASNLSLSTRRAQAVVSDLIARGIPAERFQVLAKGATESVVPNSPGTPEPRDRRVEITWR